MKFIHFQPVFFDKSCKKGQGLQKSLMSGLKHGGQVIIPDYLEFNDNSVFDVTMDSYNRAEICELVGRDVAKA